MDEHFYNTIEIEGVAEFKDRSSKFLAFAFPVQDVDECKERIAFLKKEHPKANHHCFSYRLGLDNNNFRVSDAGEPSGTAGRPILGQIDSKGVTNVLIVVVRYFGGTLLGVQGLINAYKSAAAMVLQVIPLVRKPILINYQLEFDYTRMNEVMMIVKQTDCAVLKQDMQLFCMMEIGIPQYRMEEALRRFEEVREVRMKASD